MQKQGYPIPNVAIGHHHMFTTSHKPLKQKLLHAKRLSHLPCCVPVNVETWVTAPARNLISVMVFKWPDTKDNLCRLCGIKRSAQAISVPPRTSASFQNASTSASPVNKFNSKWKVLTPSIQVSICLYHLLSLCGSVAVLIKHIEIVICGDLAIDINGSEFCKCPKLSDMSTSTFGLYKCLSRQCNSGSSGLWDLYIDT